MSDDLLIRIERAAVMADAHDEAAKREKALRDDLIREAIDSGVSYGKVARAARRSKGRVAAIVGES